MTKLDGMTPDLAQENIEKLKELFPDVFTEGKVDFDKLQQVLGNYIETSPERYNLTWNGKSQALRLAQTPSVGTLRPCKEESKDWDSTKNLYIEGDNLEVLKLLQKSYHGKIKMIYIDPPYNTGGDFVYPDNFTDSIENYKVITGQVDSEGNSISSNSETSGRYHTDWLNMLYPRLRLARNLLRNNGVVFISIGWQEMENALKIAKEIFGEENFLGLVTWKSRVKPINIGRAKFRPQKETDYVIVFARDILKVEFLPLFTGGIRTYPHEINGRKYRIATILKSNRGTNYRSTMSFSLNEYTPTEGQRWQAGETVIKQLWDDGYIEFKEGTPFRRYFEDEEDAEHDPFYCFLEQEWTSTAEAGKLELSTVLGTNNHDFDTVKPIQLIKTLIMSCIYPEKEEIVMDFFSGSATTAHAVMQVNIEDQGNRKFIMVQLPESCDEKSEAYKTGYSNICEIGKERIRKAGEKIKEKTGLIGADLDIGFKVFKLDTSNIRKWQPDYNNIEQSLTDYVDNYVDGRSEFDVVYEIILKCGLDLAYSIDEYEFDGKKVYAIGFGALMICLANDITMDVAQAMVKLKNQLSPETWKVVFKDNGFKSDSDKTNIKEILKCGGLDEDAFTTL